jgi:hypothetical protein
MISTGSAIENDDTYGLAILIRAFVESTVVLTVLVSKMHAFAGEKISYTDFDKIVTALLGGSRLSKYQPENPQAINIMTLIPKADIFVDTMMSLTVVSPLSTIYSVLSDYAHPNSLSNGVAIQQINLETGEYHFRHDGKITDAHIALLGMLNTSAQIFENVSVTFLDIIVQRNDHTKRLKKLH